MKRAGNLFERVVSRDNLRLASARAVRGKRDRPDALCFMEDLDEHLDLMAGELRTGRFPVGRYHQFVIHDPKERVITAPCFAERVLHHAVMNVCEPVFERWLIHDTYACRTGRGRVAALERAREYAGRHPVFLKFDIRRYFDSISHEILRSLLRRLFKDRMLLDLLDRIILSFETSPGRGLPIGSLTSQHMANFHLGWYDRYAKETLRVKGYVRYMDDVAMWFDSLGVARAALEASRQFLAERLGLEMKWSPYINKTIHGMDFLGARIFGDRVVLNRRSRLRLRRKLARLESQFAQGEIDALELQRRTASLIAFTRSGGVKSWSFRRAVIEGLPVSGHRPGTG